MAVDNGVINFIHHHPLETTSVYLKKKKKKHFVLCLICLFSVSAAMDTRLTSSSLAPPPLLLSLLHPKLLSTSTAPIRLWFPSSSSSPPSRVSLSSSNSSSVKQISSRFGSIRCQALGDKSVVDPTPPVYQGIYGPWSVDSADIREVILYRAGLVTAATSFVIAASTAILPDDIFLTNILKQNLDVFYALGAGGLGLSLFLIHIYVTEIKRTLQALWGIGVLGSVATFVRLAQPVNESLPQYVVDHPTAVWFVGPLFAALTGLVFKEGLCYGKLEAGILTFIIPTVLLGHLSGLMDDGLKLNLLGVWMVLFAVFAARKFTQPIKDDIGDKSVFIFNALPDNKKQAVLEKLGEQKLNQDSN